MFTITGIIAGEREHITYQWNNGVGSYEGSPLATFLMEGAQERTSPVGPVGQPHPSRTEQSAEPHFAHIPRAHAAFEYK